ncbi:hypothetical protein [Rhodococcus oxybenzonivorans]|uniref:hypothetical protein n=1 Tax=Rhodococcus oxybenzonivorans TaxID=1990687 RepID=UPI0019522D1D|nr:hypothetical protein [Rhodococcus oxybenzonivorans]
MAREAVFDPTDRYVFNEQRQRFDWSLLLNGTVFRYDSRFQLDSACNRLSDLDYLVHRIDAQAWTSVEDMFDPFSEAMGCQRSYGGSVAAFDDVFADVGIFAFGSDPKGQSNIARLRRAPSACPLTIQFSGQSDHVSRISTCRPHC